MIEEKREGGQNSAANQIKLIKEIFRDSNRAALNIEDLKIIAAAALKFKKLDEQSKERVKDLVSLIPQGVKLKDVWMNASSARELDRNIEQVLKDFNPSSNNLTRAAALAFGLGCLLSVYCFAAEDEKGDTTDSWRALCLMLGVFSLWANYGFVVSDLLNSYRKIKGLADKISTLSNLESALLAVAFPIIILLGAIGTTIDAAFPLEAGLNKLSKALPKAQIFTEIQNNQLAYNLLYVIWAATVAGTTTALTFINTNAIINLPSFIKKEVNNLATNIQERKAISVSTFAVCCVICTIPAVVRLNDFSNTSSEIYTKEFNLPAKSAIKAIEMVGESPLFFIAAIALAKTVHGLLLSCCNASISKGGSYQQQIDYIATSDNQDDKIFELSEWLKIGAHSIKYLLNAVGNAYLAKNPWAAACSFTLSAMLCGKSIVEQILGRLEFVNSLTNNTHEEAQLRPYLQEKIGVTRITGDAEMGNAIKLGAENIKRSGSSYDIPSSSNSNIPSCTVLALEARNISKLSAVQL
jgi:hypothetical protein